MFEACRQSQAQNYKAADEASDGYLSSRENVISDGQNNVSAMGRDSDS
jgi:prophage tail gpP-like protein